VNKRLIIGTRGSRLALWQANFVADLIRTCFPALDVATKHIITTGDKILDVPLAKIGGKGLFTKELEKELLAGGIDLAVHSLKDLPTELPPGLKLAAVPERADPGDALVSARYAHIDSLPPGARLGTSSLRRKAQLLHYRPDLAVTDLRGNLDTRLAKLHSQELDAIVLAVSGLERLGWQHHITQVLPGDVCLPAVGQGALAIESREDDPALAEIMTFLHHPQTAAAVAAERAFLHQLQGGCQVPIAAHGRVAAGVLELQAAILSPDGRRKMRDSINGPPAAAVDLGRALACRMYDQGGRAILAEGACEEVGH
jgi:hydroxymethylbilane synthase